MDMPTDNVSFTFTEFIASFSSAMENEAYLFLLAAFVYLGFSSKSWMPRLCGKEASTSQKAGRAAGKPQQGYAKRSNDKQHPRPNPVTESGAHSNLVTQAKSIREQGKAGNLLAAIALFDELKKEHAPRNSMTTLCYNSIIDACVQCGEGDKATRFLNEAKECALADVVTYNTVIKGHLGAGRMTDARNLFLELGRHGLKANLVTYHSLLHASVLAGDWRGAWQYMSDLRENGLKPTSVTCSILLKFAAEPRNKAYVPRIFAIIDEMDTPFDEILVSAVVEACVQTHRMDFLAERLQEFERKGLLAQLSAPTYGAMIKAFGQVRDTEKVWALWQLMKQYDVRPSDITLGCVVDALVMNGAVDDAWTLVKDIWEDEGLKELLNNVIYSTILKGFAMSRRMDKVNEVYDIMKMRKSQCNIITFNTLLNAMARCCEVRRLAQILEDMKAADPPVEPDMITYSTLMKAYCSAGDLNMGLSLLRDMEDAKVFTPDEVMYNSLLDGCAKQNRLENAMTLLEKMKKAGVAPSNYTLSIMIKLLGRGRHLTQAFTMMDELVQKQGLRPNVQVYTCLIQACFVNRQLVKALGVHDQCVDAGCPLDEKAYVALVTGCLQAKAVEKAAEVVRCAYGLPGHSLRACKRAPGVDAKCLADVMAKLRVAGKDALAQKLSEDVAMITSPSSRGAPARNKH